MSSSVHIGTKNNDILILGEGSSKRLDDAKLRAEDKFSINFTQSGKRSVLRLHCKGGSNFLFVNATKIY